MTFAEVGYLVATVAGGLFIAATVVVVGNLFDPTPTGEPECRGHDF